MCEKHFLMDRTFLLLFLVSFWDFVVDLISFAESPRSVVVYIFNIKGFDSMYVLANKLIFNQYNHIYAYM